MELKGATLHAEYDVDRADDHSHNVAGRLQGSKRPDETVIYTAHWDHLGVGLPDAKGDRIYNGAVDNAHGHRRSCIELARAFAAAPAPDRSVVFLAVTAEEKGLLGSEYYAANPLYPLATTVGRAQHGRARRPGPGARTSPSRAAARLELLDTLVAQAAQRPDAITPDPRPEAG